MKYDRRIYIMSAEIAEYPKSENRMRMSSLWQDVHRMELMAKPSVGSYKGQVEASMVITERPTDNLRELLMTLAETYDQECIMVREMSGACYLLGNGKDEYIGEWKEVPDSIAYQSEAFTSVDGKNFITTKF